MATTTDNKQNGRALPEGWEWKTIEDVVDSSGVFIDGDWVESKDQDPNGEIRLIQLADVGDERGQVRGEDGAGPRGEVAAVGVTVRVRWKINVRAPCARIGKHYHEI